MRRRNRTRAHKAPIARNKEEKCVTKYCRNRKALKATYYKARNGTTTKYESFLSHCWKCRARMLKNRQPVTYVLNMLRHSARKRNLPFTLTKAEFAQFCQETGYLERRGNKKDSLTIDRVDWNEGYHIWNLKVVTHTENSAQGSDNTPRTERGAAQAEPDDQPLDSETNEPF